MVGDTDARTRRRFMEVAAVIAANAPLWLIAELTRRLAMRFDSERRRAV